METTPEVEHFVQGVDVSGDAGDQAARPGSCRRRRRAGAADGGNLAAKIEHHFLSGPLHEVGLQELEQKTEHQQSNINAAICAMPVPARGLSQVQKPADEPCAGAR